jgi:signal peptidase I
VSTADVSAEVSATQSSSVGRRPRNPWVAAALTFLGGSTGLVYCGRLRRALLWDISLLFVLLAVGCLLFYFPNGRIAWIAMALLIVAYPLALIADTVHIARRRERASKWYQRRWFYVGFAIITSFAVRGAAQLCRKYWEEAFYIPTGSMSPTVSKGDRILVDKLRYRTTPIHHEDVIVFRADDRQFSPGSDPAPAGRLYYVKRVVGLPGDVIEFRDEKLIRNGERVDEPYAAFVPVSGRIDPRLTDMAPVTVGKNEVFVVGDNRRESLDSRFFGCISRDDVVGRAAIIYWSRESPPEDVAANPSRNRQPSAPEPPRRIRWERFGQRVE